MKIHTILFLAVLVAPISAYCAEPLESLEQMKTRYGIVSVKPAEFGDRDVYINEKKLPISDHLIAIEKKWEIGAKDILLISTSSGGSACASSYVFLIVSQKQAVASADFGNCSDMPDVSRIKDTILVKFPRMSRNNPAETTQYDNGKVYGKIFQPANRIKKQGEVKLETTAF